ncbi:MAG: efflux RND transporter periplasmic adaptor subunit [Bacteroidetes bacterium]|nr:efflux RND transporter periplasmic adaptor subunit [Bacteroidota bacterium]
MKRIYTGQSLPLLFMLALVLAAASGCGNKKKPVAASVQPAAPKKELWTCSMHPEIIRDKPGSCPICGMDLVKKETQATAINGLDLDELLQPTDKFILSSIPVTALQKEQVRMEKEALGAVTYDTRYINTISARVSGRIEKLYVQYRYQHVHKGARIMDVYSPELLTAEQELLFLLKNDPSNQSLIAAARQKLLQLGMDEAALRQMEHSGKASATVAVYSSYTGHLHEAGNTMPVMEGGGSVDFSQVTEGLTVKEGMYVQQGQTIFQLYNTDRSWVLLNIFPGDDQVIKAGDAVDVVPETMPEKRFSAKIDFIEPVYRKDSRTLTARVYFDNASKGIPIGSQVRATIYTGARAAEWLPKDAVMSLGFDKIVFLKQGTGFRAHKVVTGVGYKDRIQITGGLEPADSVAANAQFLADSESFIKIK